jgi:hypothetical protein
MVWDEEGVVEMVWDEKGVVEMVWDEEVVAEMVWDEEVVAEMVWDEEGRLLRGYRMKPRERKERGMGWGWLFCIQLWSGTVNRPGAPGMRLGMSRTLSYLPHTGKTFYLVCIFSEEVPLQVTSVKELRVCQLF